MSVKIKIGNDTLTGVNTVRFKNADNPSAFVSLSVDLPALTAPTISMSGDTVSWSAVTNAKYYVVYANGNVIASTIVRSVNVREPMIALDYADGTYSITVRAFGDGISYGSSGASNSVSYDFVGLNDLAGTTWEMSPSYWRTDTGVTYSTWLNLVCTCKTATSASYDLNYIKIIKGQYVSSNNVQFAKASDYDNLYIQNLTNFPKWVGKNNSSSSSFNVGSDNQNLIITITGGTKSKDANLIKWFKANCSHVS